MQLKSSDKAIAGKVEEEEVLHYRLVRACLSQEPASYEEAMVQLMSSLVRRGQLEQAYLYTVHSRY